MSKALMGNIASQHGKVCAFLWREKLDKAKSTAVLFNLE